MAMQLWIGVVVLLLSSLWLMYLGIMSLRGEAKKRYLHSARGAQVPYMAIPVSISLICMVFMMFSNNDKQAGTWLYIATGFFFWALSLPHFSLGS